MLKLYNTLTKQKEEFTPLSQEVVGMYNCGPTVYDRVHIGNLRSFILADTLRRTIEWNGFTVLQVMNLTDVGHLTSDADTGDDKMVKTLKREGKELTLENMKSVATFYADTFMQDIQALNFKIPQKLPYASEHIPEQIELIKKLEEKGFSYTTNDGVYFDTSKDKYYGKLGGLSGDTQERIAENKEKKNPQDFALWKFGDIGWESPWGKGFPGWHIECSAMSMKYLGETFDIHTGGIDNKPTHHNNEIAQSESVTGKPLAHYWLHGEHINLSGNKMAKSAGDFITLETLQEKGFDPLAYRYLLLGAHYRTSMEFSWEALEAAQTALTKLRDRLSALGEAGETRNENYTNKFTEAINDDLNTSQALAVLWELLKDENVTNAEKKATILAFDAVLGLALANIKQEPVPKKVTEFAQEREAARNDGDFDKADELRKKIEELGYAVRDTDSGPAIKKQH